jgi:hypothetical protein
MLCLKQHFFCYLFRKQAIKDLPILCKDNKEHTQKIADILAQLLQAEDNAELSVVHNSLMTLFKSDAKGKKHVRILIAACILQLKIHFSDMQVIYTFSYENNNVTVCIFTFFCSHLYCYILLHLTN